MNLIERRPVDVRLGLAHPAEDGDGALFDCGREIAIHHNGFDVHQTALGHVIGDDHIYFRRSKSIFRHTPRAQFEIRQMQRIQPFAQGLQR